MFPEQAGAHHQHLNIHEWIIKQAQQAQAQCASGTMKMSYFEVLVRQNASSSLDIKYVPLYQKYDPHFALCSYFVRQGSNVDAGICNLCQNS